MEFESRKTRNIVPVAYDKSIYLLEDGTYLLMVREDDNTLNLPKKTLIEAQETADRLPSDGGDYLARMRSVFNPTTKGTRCSMPKLSKTNASY